VLKTTESLWSVNFDPPFIWSRVGKLSEDNITKFVVLVVYA
jgi:hypothetical protein